MASPAPPEPAEPVATQVVDTPQSRLASEHRQVRRLLGWATVVGGIGCLLALLPGVHHRLGLAATVGDESVRVVGHVASVLVGLALLLLAHQLSRGKQRAWLLAVALFLVTAVAHVIKGPHPIVVAYSLVMVALLIWKRDAFTAKADPGSIGALVWFVPAYLATVVGFGAVTLVLEREHVEEELSVFGVLQAVFAGLVGLDGPYEYSGTFFEDFFPAALLALGIAGLLIFSLLLFRAVARRDAPSEDDREHARRLVRLFGDDTLDYFALRPDKSYFFASDGEAMIAYTYTSGYALVAADPIGAPGSEARVLDEFLEFCAQRAWRVAFLAVRESDVELYRARGFLEVYLGDEAIIPCDEFTLSGAPMKSVRSAVARVGRDHRFRLMRETDASPQLVEDLNKIRERWRGKAPERGFTMELGGGVRGENPDFLLAVAFDPDERPLGFLRLVPCFGPDPGWSLDLMQRDPEAPNGMTEFLIANTALALGERGFKRLSMNFAAWGRLFDTGAELSLGQRIAKKVAEVLNPYFQIKSLRDFNAKFDPRWGPRSIMVEDVGSMPTVGLLYASVEGFLNLPLVGRRLEPRQAPTAPPRLRPGDAVTPA
jgi:lysyl-tRNA synthetase, class II